MKGKYFPWVWEGLSLSSKVKGKLRPELTEGGSQAHIWEMNVSSQQREEFMQRTRVRNMLRPAWELIVLIGKVRMVTRARGHRASRGLCIILK